MKQHSRYQTARRLLIFWTLFVAIGAVGGALEMLLDPSGKLMGINHTQLRSIRCREGIFRRV